MIVVLFVCYYVVFDFLMFFNKYVCLRYIQLSLGNRVATILERVANSAVIFLFVAA